MLEVDYHFQCPYCWQPISMRLDLTGGDQRYVEDCERCCNPIEIAFRVRDGEIEDFTTDATQSILD